MDELDKSMEDLTVVSDNGKPYNSETQNTSNNKSKDAVCSVMSATVTNEVTDNDFYNSTTRFSFPSLSEGQAVINN